MTSKNNLEKFMYLTFMAFTTAITVITLIGVFAGDEIISYSTFYVNGGVSLTAIVQILVLAVITALINIIFDSESLVAKVRVLYLTLIKLFLILLIATAFIFIFKWFPVDEVYAWISFVAMFLVCFIIATIASVLVTRKKDKEYEEMLTKYKERAGKK
ncbi:DUF3021 family protein [Breznakia pachnodae]|uniref:Membrane protein DedA with SNARE-associated domain n=1 Tax=Breznakia pachnodae TaxID=265178 RepID=A0ABU0E562_9FIRM|nr:DUF3021 family protein [Breznakia pachnodae]MDQ0362038.1 membrane protein DedA with SNARE-associated domain [Breznakia pachnodae]